MGGTVGFVTATATSSPSEEPVEAGSGSYKWIALSNTTIGILMATINSSILLIALPDIFTGIKINPLLPSNTTYFLWILMGYMVVTAVLVVSFGRLGDMFGRVRMYNLGFATFTLFSILLSVTWMTGPAAALWLIAMRILQGVGGAFLMANSSAILTDAFPENERGMALGINSVAGIAGSFIGLILGGLLGPVDWRLVFLVSVPIGLFGTIWAYLKLRDTGVRNPARIDWWGNVTFAVGLVLVLVGITYGIEPAGGSAMGWTSVKVLTELSVGAAFLVAFGVIETRVADPMFRLKLFRIRAFSAGNLASLLASLARGGLMFVLIIWLQGIWLPRHGYSFSSTPLWAGIYMLPLTVGFLVAGPLSGVLSDRFGARPFATAGMVAAAASFGLLELVPADFRYLWFALLLLLNGLAMGLFSSPNRAGIMNSLPPTQRGAGAGMVSTFQNAAMVLSIGIFFTLIIVGLTASLPQAMEAGLVAQGVARAAARHVAHVPAVSTLFAAFLGYNPIKSLLGPTGVLAHLPAAKAAYLTGRGFFPALISRPFADGLHEAFDFSIAACLLAAIASWLRGGKYHYRAADAAASEPAVAAAIGAGPGSSDGLALAGVAPANGAEPVTPPLSVATLAGGSESPAANGGSGLVPLEELAAAVDHWRSVALSAAEPPTVVTISASYGAGGSIVAPRVAERLGLVFVDRAIPKSVAEHLAVSGVDGEAAADDEEEEGGLRHLLATMSLTPGLYGLDLRQSAAAIDSDDRYRLTTEAVLWYLAATTGAVVLGRVGAVVLRDDPAAVRVRLDGPLPARIRQAMRLDGVDEATARRHQAQVDRAREHHARRLYGAELSDPSLYHLVLDSTAIELEECVELVVGAASHLRLVPST
jgi:MFS family permease